MGEPKGESERTIQTALPLLQEWIAQVARRAAWGNRPIVLIALPENKTYTAASTPFQEAIARESSWILRIVLRNRSHEVAKLDEAHSALSIALLADADPEFVGRRLPESDVYSLMRGISNVFDSPAQESKVTVSGASLLLRLADKRSIVRFALGGEERANALDAASLENALVGEFPKQLEKYFVDHGLWSTQEQNTEAAADASAPGEYAAEQSSEGPVADRIIEEFGKNIASRLDELPRDFAVRREVLRTLHTALRAALARSFEPVLNEHAATLPQATYDDKKALAKWVNAELRELGIAIRSPRSGEPCRLMGNPGGRPGEGRFVLEYLDETGRRRHPLTAVKLPPLRLVPDDLGRASYAPDKDGPRSR